MRDQLSRRFAAPGSRPTHPRRCRERRVARARRSDRETLAHDLLLNTREGEAHGPHQRTARWAVAGTWN